MITSIAESHYEWRTTKGTRIGFRFDTEERAKDWAVTYAKLTPSHKALLDSASLYIIKITKEEKLIK